MIAGVRVMLKPVGTKFVIYARHQDRVRADLVPVGARVGGERTSNRGEDFIVTKVLDAFERFRSNLELTGLQESAVAERQLSVRAAVTRELTVIDAFLTGSYRRHTLIAPLSTADVDVIVVLD